MVEKGDPLGREEERHYGALDSPCWCRVVRSGDQRTSDVGHAQHQAPRSAEDGGAGRNWCGADNAAEPLDLTDGQRVVNKCPPVSGPLHRALVIRQAHTARWSKEEQGDDSAGAHGSGCSAREVHIGVIAQAGQPPSKNPTKVAAME